MAVVTFGGAYAVLAYVAQQAVEARHWLRPGEMVDGLGLAETTPGPLIITNQFVGFLAAYRAPGARAARWPGPRRDPDQLGDLPAVVRVDLPRRAPFTERLREAKALNAAPGRHRGRRGRRDRQQPCGSACGCCSPRSSRVHALGLGFDLPVPSSVNWPALVLTVGAALGLFGLKIGPIKVLAACAAAGALYTLSSLRRSGHLHLRRRSAPAGGSGSR